MGSPFGLSRRLPTRQDGFTLIELLVVILIIAILIAVAAPSFLGQTKKAQDSVAEQYLSIAYQAAKAASVSHASQGSWGDPGTLATEIKSIEPELNPAASDVPPLTTLSGGKTNVSISVTSTILTIYSKSASGNDCQLSAVANGALSGQICQSPVDAGFVTPSSSSPPLISGASHLQVGGVLSASTGSWANNPAGYTYQWQHSTDGSNWTNATGSGSASSSYTVDASDLNDFLRVVVTASNGGGPATASSDPTSAVLPADPQNSTLPSFTGTVQVGSPLTADPGTWTSSPTGYSYQWRTSPDGSSWTNATGSGATSAVYTVASSDFGNYLQVCVQASNSGGSGSACSGASASAASPAVPVNTGSPTISGTVQVGNTLTADPGTWSSQQAPSYSYQWQTSANGSSGWSDISAATAATYVITSSDYNQYLRAVVTAANSGGTSAPANSSATSQILPAVPTDTALPTVPAAPQQGSVQTAGNGSWSGQGTISYGYQWLSCTDNSSTGSCLNATGSGATTQNYIPGSADVGNYLRVVVIASNSGGPSAAATSAPSAAAALPAAPTNNGAAPSVSGTAQVGSTLTATAGGWTGSPTFTYQWQRGTTDISGATGTSYAPVAGDVGSTIRVKVTGTNSGGSLTATSAATAAVVGVPVLVSSPSLSSAQEGSTTTANAGSWSPAATSYSYAWYNNGSLVQNGSSASYTPGAGNSGHSLYVIVTASNAAGSGTPAQSNTISIAAGPTVSCWNGTFPYGSTCSYQPVSGRGVTFYGNGGCGPDCYIGINQSAQVNWDATSWGASSCGFGGATTGYGPSGGFIFGSWPTAGNYTITISCVAPNGDSGGNTLTYHVS